MLQTRWAPCTPAHVLGCSPSDDLQVVSAWAQTCHLFPEGTLTEHRLLPETLRPQGSKSRRHFNVTGAPVILCDVLSVSKMPSWTGPEASQDWGRSTGSYSRGGGCKGSGGKASHQHPPRAPLLKASPGTSPPSTSDTAAHPCRPGRPSPGAQEQKRRGSSSEGQPATLLT